MKLGNIMIFGDSYSTYEGYIPEGYAKYYSGHRTGEPDVFDVKNTWWGRLIDATDANLLQNNSWSGSTIGYTGYDNRDCSKDSSFRSQSHRHAFCVWRNKRQLVECTAW